MFWVELKPLKKTINMHCHFEQTVFVEINDLSFFISFSPEWHYFLSLCMYVFYVLWFFENIY